MRVDLDAILAWPGGCGCLRWQARHHRRGREGRGKKRLTRGPRESVGEKGEKGAAWNGQAAAAWAERRPPGPRRLREQGAGEEERAANGPRPDPGTGVGRLRRIEVQVKNRK